MGREGGGTRWFSVKWRWRSFVHGWILSSQPSFTVCRLSSTDQELDVNPALRCAWVSVWKHPNDSAAFCLLVLFFTFDQEQSKASIWILSIDSTMDSCSSRTEHCENRRHKGNQHLHSLREFRIKWTELQWTAIYTKKWKLELYLMKVPHFRKQTSQLPWESGLVFQIECSSLSVTCFLLYSKEIQAAQVASPPSSPHSRTIKGCNLVPESFPVFLLNLDFFEFSLKQFTLFYG